MRWGVLLVLLAAMPAAAQPCPGDCNGDGEVRVEEMIVGVRIALGEVEVADCSALDANGNGTLSIDELVRAVANLLTGCPAEVSPTPTETPSPSPIATATATPAETATATATPTIPPLAGSWIEAPLAVTDSTCAQELTTAFADELANRGPCSQVVEQLDASRVRVTDCSEQAVEGELDRDGTMHLVFPPSDGAVTDCTVTLRVASVIAGGADPVTATYTFGFVFGGAVCPLENCTIAASATWTRPQGAP
jgi:hypothetical protein